VRAAVVLGSVAVATVLLLAVAGGAAAPRVDLGRSSGGFALLLDVLTLLVVAGSLTGLVLLMTSLRFRRSTVIQVERRRRSFAGLVTLVVVLLVFRLLPDPRPQDGQGPTVGLGDGIAQPAEEPVRIVPDATLTVAALLGAVVLAAMAAIARRQIDRRVGVGDPLTADDHQERSRMRAVTLVLRDDLESIEDPKAAILAAYDHLRMDLEEQGVAPRPDDTPRRVVVRALDLADMPRAAIVELVAIFEEARFSTHPIGQDHRGRALDALDEVERVLQAPADHG